MRSPSTIATPVAHVVGPGKLKVANGRIVFATAERARPSLDVRSLKVVYCHGPVGVTDDALALLVRHQVQVAWLSSRGDYFRARIALADSSSVLLRIAQHRFLSDRARRLRLASKFVLEKITAQAAAARHYQRQGKESGSVLHTLRHYANEARRAESLESLRGIEGAAAQAWFGFLGEALRLPWHFTKRVRRPPTDPVNALLSLGYTFLTRRVGVKLISRGFEIALGALHEFRAGRPSLACDAVEPFRAPAVDRWVVATCNEGRLRVEDFESNGSGVRLRAGLFPNVLTNWEEWWTRGDFDAQVENLLTELEQTFRSVLSATEMDDEHAETPGTGASDEEIEGYDES